MKTRPRPNTKLPKVAEIGPDMYSHLFFWWHVLKTFKNQQKRGQQACFFQVFIKNSKQRVAEGGSGWHYKLAYSHGSNAPVVPMFRWLKSRLCHDFVILCRPLFVIFTLTDRQTINQTKYLVLDFLTFNNQEKSIYVPKSIGHFSPLMLPIAVSQLNTS